MKKKIKYEPFYNENTDELINDIRNSLKTINEDQVTIDTLDICHLLGKIDDLEELTTNLQEENKRIFSKVNDDELLISNAMNYAEAQNYKSRIDKAIEYLKGNEHTCNYVDIYNYALREEDLLNILEGDEKE